MVYLSRVGCRLVGCDRAGMECGWFGCSRGVAGQGGVWTQVH